jgi:parallel beta-helix repeat protein
VTGATNVIIKGFTISGPGNGTAGSIGYGIEVDGGGSALIISNQITQIEDNPISGFQSGVGIEIGNSSTSQVGSARIWGNTIYDYQKDGIDISGGGSSATINFNTVIGQGPISTIAQNGVQVDTGANALIINNRILNNLYVPTTYNGSGIILENPGKVTITNNIVENNDVGINSYGATGVDIAENIIVNNYDNGIVLYQTSGSIVQANAVNRNGSYHYDVMDQVVDGGIALFDSSDNTIEYNIATGNTVGYYADASSSFNSFNHNIMSCSLVFGAEDLSGGTGTAHTANFWHGNNLGAANNPELLLS